MRGLVAAFCIVAGVAGGGLLLYLGQPPILAALCVVAGIMAAVRAGGRP